VVASEEDQDGNHDDFDESVGSGFEASEDVDNGAEKTEEDEEDSALGGACLVSSSCFSPWILCSAPAF